jgi:hypothetical protein
VATHKTTSRKLLHKQNNDVTSTLRVRAYISVDLKMYLGKILNIPDYKDLPLCQKKHVKRDMFWFPIQYENDSITLEYQ